MSCLLLAAGLMVAAGAVFLGLRAAGRWLSVDEALSPADAIVVLANDISRTRHGVELYGQGYAPLIAFSNGRSTRGGQVCYSAPLALEDARRLGLPEDAALVTDVATSTYEEAVNVRRMATEHGWDTIIVVTNPLHTRRASRAFRSLMPDVTVLVSAAPDPDYDVEHWWSTEAGFLGVFQEFLKLAYYWVRYGIAPF